MAHFWSTTSGGVVEIDDQVVSSFRNALGGPSFDVQSIGFNEARAVWNGMIDRQPGLIVRCLTVADVVMSVAFARDHGLLLAVRGAGHNIAGSAVCDGGVVIDLSLMKSIRVDPQLKRAWVGPGSTLADIDREAQTFGLAVPTGINSTTGIAGLTLGGGFGWTTRKLGLTIDSLVSAEVVTASAEVLRCSTGENADLYWALRGGGGNFGIVTGFEFDLHPVGPQVLAGLIAHPLADAKAVLGRYRDLMAAAPDELTCWAVLRQAPPLPFLPTDWHGRGVLLLALCWIGDLTEGERATAALRGLGSPIAEAIGPTAFVDWQTAFDPLLTPGARNYWKSHDFRELSDQAITVLADAAEAIPGPESEIFIFHIGGAASRVDPASTAFPQRRAHFGMNIHARWREKSMDDDFIRWARETFDAAAPFTFGTAYVNFMAADEADRTETAYGDSYQRLMVVKRRYDPGNVFRMNQNLRP